MYRREYLNDANFYFLMITLDLAYEISNTALLLVNEKKLIRTKPEHI